MYKVKRNTIFQIVVGAVLMLSLSLNYIFYKADIEYWLEYRKIVQIETTYSPILDNIERFHEELTCGSLEFLKNEKRVELPQYMSVLWTERFKKSLNKKELPILNVIHAEQDAFMFIELLEDAIRTGNKERINYLKSYFDSHTLELPFEHRDQAVEAIISLRLYSYTKEKKYLNHAMRMYKWLVQQGSEYGILYIPGLNVSIVDVLGMIVPFLVEYSSVFNSPEAYELALRQIEIYTKYGCDKETGIPAFGYSVKSPHVKTERMNWGRGISWFVIGLSYVDAKRLSIDCQETIQKLNNTLSEIWEKEHRFDHFVYDIIRERDMSAELPIIYYLSRTGNISLSKKDILEYSKYMHKGIMYHCSNSNEGAIRYGIVHGPMMLAQAFMLRLTK